MKSFFLAIFAVLVTACSNAQSPPSARTSSTSESSTRTTTMLTTTVTSTTVKPPPDRAALQQSFIAHGESQRFVDCVLGGIDPAIDNDTALRIASTGPNPNVLAEVTFADQVVSCRAVERSDN